MRCKKCDKKNSRIAKYCIKCGNKFTEEERVLAEKRSFKTFYNNMKSLKDLPGLKFIYEHDVVKLAGIILIIIGGVYATFLGKNKFELKVGSDYLLEYRETDNEYYILQEKNYNKENGNKIAVNINIPNSIDKIYVNLYEFDGELISEEVFNKKDEIILKANTDGNNYYLISDNKDFKDAFKVLTYVYSLEG